MVYLKNKYVYYSGRKKRKNYFKLIVLILILLGIPTSLYFLFTHLSSKPPLFAREDPASYKNLWEAKKYDELITMCDVVLAEEPYEPRSLSYKSLALFFKGDTEVGEAALYHEQSIALIRKALLGNVIFFEKELNYILGMCYFYKGTYYYDLAVKYIAKAIDIGYKDMEALIRLGLAQGFIGNTEKELECFLQAAEEKVTEKLLLLIGKSYIKLNQFDKAEEYLIRCINMAENESIELEARFALGEIYFENKEYFKAEDQYKAILKVDNYSSKAHFSLGEIYTMLNDHVKARAEYRQTLKIDPSHYGAKLRVYK